MIFLTKDSTLSTNYLITMEILNVGAVLKKNSALTIFRTLNGNNIYATSFLEKNKRNNADNLLLPNHHLIKKNTLVGIEKLNSRQLYSLLVYTHPFTPTSQKYLNELFKTDSFDWKQIYLLPRLVTLDSYPRSFQYKILNNVLYLNKKLFTFRKSTSPLCPFCKLSDETVLYLFYECNITLNLWNEIVLFFENEFTLFDLTPQAAFLGFLGFFNVDPELL